MKKRIKGRKPGPKTDDIIPLQNGTELKPVEQIDELQDRLKGKKELQKETAAQLRQAGMTQKRVAAVIGVEQRTISNWDGDVSNRNSSITNIPDMRVSIPKIDK